MRHQRRSYHSDSAYVRTAIRPQICPVMLKLGMKSEAREHKTFNVKQARRIALDHLRENPRYYDNLLPSAYVHND